MFPKISIITIVYNNRDSVKRTIESVLNQTYKNIEFVVVDGGSNDGTVEEIQRFIDQTTVFVSEKDKGIYDAMNKGITLASGDWILFLNSGDFFDDIAILAKLAALVIENKTAEILYGDIKVLPNIGTTYVQKARSIAGIKTEMIASHQACFIKRKLHLKYNYNLEYKFSADYEFFFKSYLAGASIVRVPLVIAVITGGGVSDLNRINVFKERLKIKNNLNPTIINYIDYCKSISYCYLVNAIKKYSPIFLINKLYAFKYGTK